MSFEISSLWKILKIVIVVYLLYALVFSLVPYALPTPVSQKHKELFQSRRFTGDGSPDRVALVETPTDAFTRRIQLLRSAEKTIDMTYHTIRPGITTDYFFAEVLQAADRGVKVRLLLDAKVGGMTTGEKKLISYALSSHPNIEFKVYNEFGFLTPWRWNTLLHDKFIIIDDTYLLSGGRNIGDIYFDPPGHQVRVSNDRDILVVNTAPQTQGSVIPRVQEYMEYLWNQELSVPLYSSLSPGKEKKGAEKKEAIFASLKILEEKRPDFFAVPTPKEYREQTVATGKISMINNPVHASKKEPWAGYDIAQLALRAKEKVVIQTPYATGNKDLLQVLSQVSQNGVELEMLTNSMGVSPNYPAFSNYYSQRKKFLATGAKIYEYQDPVGSLHGKSYLFDDHLSVVGSLNLDDRSFYIDTETVFVVDSPEFYTILRETIQGHQDHSLVVGEDNTYIPNPLIIETPSSGFKKGLMGVSSLFSRLFQFLI